MENHSRNIYDIVRKNICISCGVCYSICPFKAIVWDRNNLQPKINIEKCIGCKMCVNVCPSIEILNNYNKIYSNLESYLLGPIKEVYLGWSKNKKLRYKASSGGFVTQFLLDLMELGEIDGAIVTIQNNLLPYLGSAIIARNKRNIIMAKGSKYTLSSPGLLIKDIMKTNEKFAFVGLPCQILGLKKIEKFYKTLKEKIVLYIGLFCGHVPYRELYELIIKKEFGNNYSIKDIKRIEYRGDGWPGYLKIILKDGSILKLPHDYWIKNYFSTMIF
ncbi:MAG: Coenzyme F420 hydrogenase/dehydrogenase, beta subunit C-terminal domain, partial [Candidatus Aenigmatarchaeota archaeon]